MDFQEKIDLIEKQIMLHEMVLKNIKALANIAPPEILRRQLENLEETLVQKTPHTLAQYFPKSSECGYVYVLLLQGDAESPNFFYVGFTNDVPKRMSDHFSGNAAEWTKIHPPVCILEVVQADKIEERTKTIEIMKKHGWAKTRGYCWTNRHMKGPPRELEE